ncbi:hypothetical protein [Pseudomonas moorei]|uniref:hypothetical protein n=1 Tax=Pseudomonas moorei TaxID=395599 RepID=UPI001FF4DA41|nr:hypothetical protein [Pseudomonas moorei]
MSFLLPQTDMLQMSFFVFIWCITLLTALAVTLQAKPQGWEKKWRGGNLESSALQADHGSVHDLSETVATTSEKIASIMPGMLLVVGLLGTFLGLGMALDHASTILQKSGNASVGAMGGAMQDLTAMMQGLGTKFKTSTWGIMAFILLKVWDLLLGYESRRVAWCIAKIKAQLEHSRAQQEAASKAHDAFLHGCIANAAKYVGGAMGKQADSMKLLWQQQSKIQQRTEHANQQLLQAGFDSLNTGIAGVTQGLGALLQSQTASQQAVVSEIASSTERNERALSDFAESNRCHLQTGFEDLNMGIAGITQSLGTLQQGQTDNRQALVSEIVSATERTERALSDFTESNRSHLQAGFEVLGTGITGVAQGIDGLLQGQADSQQIAREGHAISNEIANSSKRSELALTAFTESSRDNLQALQTAAQTMGDAGVKVAQSATELQAVVDNLNVRMTQVMEGVKADLNSTLTTMNDDFSHNLKTMGSQLEIATGNLAQVMDAVKVDLGSTIHTMNEDFGNNLVNMTSSLGEATKKISDSIDKMSTAVKAAMDNVAENMEKTAKAQEKTTLEFEMVSENLNTNIIAIQGVVEKLAKDIVHGLKAVSESGQRMVSLDKRYDKVSEMLITVPASLDALASAATRPTVDLSPLQQSLEQLTDVAQSINESFTARKAVEA